MRVAIYPGSFNPWHKGHKDIINKALRIFDTVIVAKMLNPEKDNITWELQKPEFYESIRKYCKNEARVYPICWSGSLKSLIDEDSSLYDSRDQFCAVIRGLRNGHDLQYEMNNQYWNEDVGVDIPFVYFITDKSLSHVSSSAIRTINKLGLKHDY